MDFKDQLLSLLEGLSEEQLDALKERLSSQKDYESWLKEHFPEAIRAGFGKRHHRLWAWFESLQLGERVRPQVEIWPRGGAKSSTGEMGVIYLASRRTRKFALVVSGTQQQANAHVGNIAAKMEQVGMKRAVGEYGQAKSWRRQQLQAEAITVAAYGLDTAIRGVKVEDYRPDIIILDDIDAINDSPEAIEKKIEALTTSVIPCGSHDCVFLVLQNLISENSIVSRLRDNRVDFLANANIPEPDPAVEDLEIEIQFDPEFGKNVWKIIGGTPTWEGQDLETCQQQIYDWGRSAFLKEAQHEVEQGGGAFFDTQKFKKSLSTSASRILKRLPTDKYGTTIPLVWILPFDLAATEGGGDYFAKIEMAKDEAGNLYITHARRKQWGSDKVRNAVFNDSSGFLHRHPFGRITLPQDPAQAGKAQRAQFEALLAGFNVKFIVRSGAKSVAARGFAEQFNLGNVYFIEDTMDDRWNADLLDQLRKYKENTPRQEDDWIDCLADGYNTLFIGKPTQVTGGMTVNPEHQEIASVTQVGERRRPWFAVDEQKQLTDDEWMAQFDQPIVRYG